MIYFISNGSLQALQTAILHFKPIRNWAGILPAPPPTQVVPTPSMKDTIMAGYHKLLGFNKDNFESIKANAMAQAEKDLRAREATRRKATPVSQLLNQKRSDSQVKAKPSSSR